MLKFTGLLLLHVISVYFLRLLWRDKNEHIQRGTVFTKMGWVSKKKSPRLFVFSIWIDFIILSILYTAFAVYSLWLIMQ